MRAFALVLSPFAWGCVEQLAPENIIATPRVLAIVASPPEAAPGEDVRLEALVVDPEGRTLDYSWSACSGLQGIANIGEQYDTDVDRYGCVDGAEGVVPLIPDGDAGVIPGIATRSLFEDLEVLAETFGEDLDPELLRSIVEGSGLPLTVGLTVYADGEELVRSFKRVLLSEREDQNTNPPAPRFAIDEVWVSGRGEAPPFVCVPEEGETPVLPRNRTLVLAPDPDDASWMETFQVVDAQGRLVEREEGAYYSWFGMAGTFSEEDTHAPLRDETWKTPRTPGPQPLWLVVRDGHGGTSACRTDVEVE